MMSRTRFRWFPVVFLCCIFCRKFSCNTGTAAEAVGDVDKPSSTTCSKGNRSCTYTDTLVPVAEWKDSEEQCGLWLAMSTLPGTGIGMFAGRNFSKDERVTPVGDHVIPIVDLQMHQESVPFFLWNSYLWSSNQLRGSSLGIKHVSAASTGIGSVANSFLDFVNVDEWNPINSVGQDLHRSKDPGAGAFTYFHSRYATALQEISVGQELFVSYGATWFQIRNDLGPIPVEGSHTKAQKLYENFQAKLMQKDVDVAFRSKWREIVGTIWDEFVLQSSWKNVSRTIAALPDPSEYERMVKDGLINMKAATMRRSEKWLEENGVCADHFYFGESRLPQAGHGVFASKGFRKGALLLPVPLIHIPDRKVLDMYEMEKGSTFAKVRNLHRPRQPQLLLNYCLGHRDSTVLLSPYGPIFNIINHNQTLANVRLQWASPKRSQHDPELLTREVSELSNFTSAKLAMELIAIRDISPDEEILLDYGDEWETAWEKHLKSWSPINGAIDYVSARDVSNLAEVLNTEFEQLKNPYPPNIMLKYHMGFFQDKKWRKMLNSTKSHEKLLKFADDRFGDGLVDAEIIKKWQGDNGRWFYRAVIPTGFDRKNFQVVREAPREAFVFEDRPYTTDTFLPNAFRHDLRIPDDIFPDAWKNHPSELSVDSPRIETRCVA